jgi:hypothetical protein
MPQGPQGQKRPVDVVGAAIRVAQISVGDIEDDSESDKARSAAAELGRLEGVARVRNLSTEQKAEIGRKGAAEPGRGCNVSLQNRCRPAATRPHSDQSADRGKNRLQRAQPDHDAGHAGHRPDPLIPAARGETQPAIYSCTNTSPCNS